MRVVFAMRWRVYLAAALLDRPDFVESNDDPGLDTSRSSGWPELAPPKKGLRAQLRTSAPSPLATSAGVDTQVAGRSVGDVARAAGVSAWQAETWLREWEESGVAVCDETGWRLSAS
jgi:hypothetical protein